MPPVGRQDHRDPLVQRDHGVRLEEAAAARDVLQLGLDRPALAEEKQRDRQAQPQARILPLLRPTHPAQHATNGQARGISPARYAAGPDSARGPSTRPGGPGFVPVSPELVPRSLFARRKHWAERFGTAPVLPMSRAEMDALGWDSCDVVLVTGDAYVDHPSFGMALVGRLLEAQGFRVGIIAQPDWRSAEPFRRSAGPTVMCGVTAGNMDSMVNRYTADRRLRARRRLHARRRGRAGAPIAR